MVLQDKNKWSAGGEAGEGKIRVLRLASINADTLTDFNKDNRQVNLLKTLSKSADIICIQETHLNCETSLAFIEHWKLLHNIREGIGGVFSPAPDNTGTRTTTGVAILFNAEILKQGLVVNEKSIRHDDQGRWAVSK